MPSGISQREVRYVGLSFSRPWYEFRKALEPVSQDYSQEALEKLERERLSAAELKSLRAEREFLKAKIQALELRIYIREQEAKGPDAPRDAPPPWKKIVYNIRDL